MDDLIDELKNWGAWLRHDAHIGPKPAQCRSAESHHAPELGDVWDPDPACDPVLGVDRAERLDAIIRARLTTVQQIALAVRYGGMQAVFRIPRQRGRSIEDVADQAERALQYWMDQLTLGKIAL